MNRSKSRYRTSFVENQKKTNAILPDQHVLSTFKGELMPSNFIRNHHETFFHIDETRKRKINNVQRRYGDQPSIMKPTTTPRRCAQVWMDEELFCVVQNYTTNAVLLVLMAAAALAAWTRLRRFRAVRPAVSAGLTLAAWILPQVRHHPRRLRRTGRLSQQSDRRDTYRVSYCFPFRMQKSLSGCTVSDCYHRRSTNAT